MDWVKNNIGLVIGGLLALFLMILAGGFLYTQMKAEGSAQSNLEMGFTDLRKLLTRNPHPGDPEKGVDNIGAVKTEQERLSSNLLLPLRKLFKPFVVPKDLDNFKFKSLLEEKVASMQRAAERSGTDLPMEGDTKYSFSFSDIRPKVDFASETLAPMAFQLLQIEALSQVLFDAKVHSINAIQRHEIHEPEEDETGEQDVYGTASQTNVDPYAGMHSSYSSNPYSSNSYSSNPYSSPYGSSTSWFGETENYISDEEITTTTNSLTGAIISPFQLGFQCFASELSAVMSGLNDSEYFFRIRWMAVEQSGSGSSLSSSSSSYNSSQSSSYGSSYNSPYGPSSTMPQSNYNMRNRGMDPSMSRYGMGTNPYGFGRGMGFGIDESSMEGLEEKPLTVNMFVEVISLPSEKPEDVAGNIGQGSY